jgi:putative DNA primase/helicase
LFCACKLVYRLAALGLAATTNPGGAGKWRSNYSATLRGARVVILPDQDLAGRRHAEMVAQSLGVMGGAAAEVRQLELAGVGEKGDVSDWIAAREREGLPREEIRRELEWLAAGAPTAGASPHAAYAGRPTRVRLASEVRPQEVVFLWRPYIACGKLTLLEGDPGQGKSWIAAALATAGSRGQGLPDAAPFAPFRTLIFTAEDGLGDTLRPRLDLLGADCDAVLLHDQPLDLAAAEDFAELERASPAASGRTCQPQPAARVSRAASSLGQPARCALPAAAASRLPASSSGAACWSGLPQPPPPRLLRHG